VAGLSCFCGPLLVRWCGSIHKLFPSDMNHK
jgi:hypothetical protein